MKSSKSKTDYLWDAWCIASVIGIWPRFIEPNVVAKTRLQLRIPGLPADLDNLKILQISDLHWGENNSPKFLSKIIEAAHRWEPDLILFSGDFLCYGQLEDCETLEDFLNAFEAKYGCYAILGNHDYQQYVSVNAQGEYDVADRTVSPIKKGWGRVLSTKKLSGVINERAKNVALNTSLMNCLRDTPFTLLHNANQFVHIGDSGLNIVGLGEHMLGKCCPSEAFEGYRENYPGIVLLHNPDGLKSLSSYPGNLVLCGHTHGGQVNLPFISRKFLQMENLEWKRGLVHLENKTAYINRGLGSVMPFRWFSVPEMLFLTLKGDRT